jgi:hypothetical protein
LRQICSEYDGVAADADAVYLMYKGHIAKLNVGIEDLQASIQRCFSNPNGISLLQRVPFFASSVASDFRSKSFHSSVTQLQTTLQAKIDHKLNLPASFYAITSNDRQSTLGSLKAAAAAVLSEAQKLLSNYLLQLDKALPPPLKAKQDFTEWLQFRWHLSCHLTSLCLESSLTLFLCSPVPAC